MMMREKLFKLHRHKSSSITTTKSGDRFDFNFSNIKVLQVPKGWDKLYVSLLSTETGKAISKSGKASLRNGTCRWTETLSEPIWISQDEASKEHEQYLFKFVVAMGSARSSILGEATINLASYTSSGASIPVTLPLQKCNHGTILQVDIQCLTPRTKCRDEKWKQTNLYVENANSDYDDLDNKSEVSDCTFTRSVGSSSSNHLDGTSHLGDLGSRETSSSVSGSLQSLDSMESSLERESCSLQSNTTGIVKHVIGRQDSAGSQFGAPYGPHPAYDSPASNHSSNNSVISHAFVTSPLRNSGSSRNFLETQEVAIEELRAEAKMWEQNARKLMLDQELRKEFTNQSKQLANLDGELSASRTECDGLKQEIEHLQVLSVESMDKQKTIVNMDNIQEVLKDEMKFQKELNDNLALQLKKSQDSNLELVSILQEMEDTIEKQKVEIENLTELKSKCGDTGKKQGFRYENNGQANPSKEVLSEKMRKLSCDSDLEGSTVENPITDLRAEFEQEDNWNLKLQLQQLGESQKNLESSILYLEKTLEEREHEIVMERDLKIHTLLDCETEWRSKLTAKEEEIINLEEKLSKAFSDRDSKVVESGNGGDLNLFKENETLKEKVQELERDCSELTNENLELLLKLKEIPNSVSCNFSSNECPANSSPVASKSEFKYQVCQLEQEKENEKMPLEGIAINPLQIQCVDPKNKCTEMELQMQALQDKASCLNVELQKCHSKAEEQEIQIAALQRQLECCQGEKTWREDPPADVTTNLENSESRTAIDNFKLLPPLFEQLQLLLVNVKKQRYTLSLPVDTEYTYAVNKSHDLKCTELITQKELEEAVFDNLIQLNKLFEAKINLCEDNLPCSNDLWKNTLCTCHQGNEELESRVADLSKELLAKTYQIGELNADHLLKEEEIEGLRHCQNDLETQISDLSKVKEQVEENMEITQRESSVTSKCLDNLKNDLIVLSSSMESHISEKEVLKSKTIELDSLKCELELHLSELEEENIHLSGRISGLEAQLRYLTDEREASRLELQHSESHAINLQDDIRRMESEMEAQKVGMKQKTEDMRNRWLEAQEECLYLKKANPKLQANAESLIEECSSLQKSNRELRQQNIELREYCTGLEVELKESRNRYSNCSKMIEALEEKFSAVREEINSKEKITSSELDALHQQIKAYTEKLVHEDLFNQIHLETGVDVEILEQEVVDLTNQIPVTRDARKVRAPADIDKVRPEAAHEEVHGKFKLSQKKLETFQIDNETKILGLMSELASCKENHETLVANHEKLPGLLEDVRSDEEKLKGTINELESKLKSSEYERLQLAEEISSLKIQLQKIPPLQDEVLALKDSLCGIKFENERLETSLQLLSGDNEELKTERISLLQRISSLQEATSELENCKRSKVALEDKVLRLTGDLTASEALCTQYAELKNELGRIRRVNSQFQWKIKHLEEEKEKWLQRAQTLEEELKQKKEVQQEFKLPEKKEEGNIIQSSKDESEPCLKTVQLQQLSENQGIVDLQRQDNNEQYDNTTSSPKITDTLSRVQCLENELAEALETNDMYKAQLKSFLSEVQIGHLEDTREKSEENKKKAALLEAELIEMRERYSDMSLKYAEVEAQKEQLVMKLKAVNSGKWRFS